MYSSIQRTFSFKKEDKKELPIRTQSINSKQDLRMMRQIQPQKEG